MRFLTLAAAAAVAVAAPDPGAELLRATKTAAALTQQLQKGVHEIVSEEETVRGMQQKNIKLEAEVAADERQLRSQDQLKQKNAALQGRIAELSRQLEEAQMQVADSKKVVRSLEAKNRALTQEVLAKRTQAKAKSGKAPSPLAATKPRKIEKEAAAKDVGPVSLHLAGGKMSSQAATTLAARHKAKAAQPDNTHVPLGRKETIAAKFAPASPVSLHLADGKMSSQAAATLAARHKAKTAQPDNTHLPRGRKETIAGKFVPASPVSLHLADGKMSSQAAAKLAARHKAKTARPDNAHSHAPPAAVVAAAHRVVASALPRAPAPAPRRPSRAGAIEADDGDDAALASEDEDDAEPNVDAPDAIEIPPHATDDDGLEASAKLQRVRKRQLAYYNSPADDEPADDADDNSDADSDGEFETSDDVDTTDDDA